MKSMNFVVRLTVLILAALLWAPLAALPADGGSRRPPNIVLIYADDLGYGDVGCYGATKVKTPQIDRLAREGRLFTDAHTVSAVCSPSRYGLLTGQYPWRVNCWCPLGSLSGLIIDPARLTVPGLLKKGGYATACFGKWHLGFGDKKPDWNGELKPGPLEVGFDYYFGVPVVNSGPPFVYVENHRVFGLDPADPLTLGPEGQVYTKGYPEKHNTRRFRGARAAHELYKDEEICTNLTARALQWIAEHKDEPFFLYFATTNIHHPFTPRPRFKNTSEAGPYGDFIQELDWAVGEILRQLDELKLADNTLAIFTSDNGGMLNRGGERAWQLGHRLNGDLLGFKFDAWEGGHRVPFVIRWPGHVPPGTRSDQLIAHVDMLATFAAITGCTLGDDDGPDSTNVLPAWTGSPARPVRDSVVLAPLRIRTHLTLRQDKWLYIPAQGPGGFETRSHSGYDWQRWFAVTGQTNSDITPKGHVKPDAPSAQLYDLESDRSQKTNVIRQHPDVAERLARQLDLILLGKRSVPAAKPTSIPK